MKKLSSETTMKIIFLIALIILIIIFFPQIVEYYENAESFIKEAGASGPILYTGLMIIAILIAPIPASPLAIIAGIIFGPFLGMLYTLIGATIGAVLAFSISRFFLGESIGKWLKHNKTYKKIRGKNNKNIIYIVFITRLMPQVSFDIVSYAAGLTGINIWSFAITTLLGMIPIVFLLTFFGYLIRPFLLWFLFFLFLIFIIYAIYKIISKSNNKTP